MEPLSRAEKLKARLLIGGGILFVLGCLAIVLREAALSGAFSAA